MKAVLWPLAILCYVVGTPLAFVGCVIAGIGFLVIEIGDKTRGAWR